MHAAVAQNKLHNHYCLQQQLRHNIWATGAQSRSFCLGAYSAPHPLNNVKGSRPDLSQKFAPPFSIFHENFQIYVAEHDDVGYIVLEQELLLGW